MVCRRCSAVVVLLAVAVRAIEPSDVLFFAPFEGSADAAFCAGNGTAAVTGQPTFEAGLRGSAAVLGPDAVLTYELARNVSSDEGTIAMWVKTDWRFDDDKFHNFFKASTGHFGGKSLNTIMLYKYPRWNRLLFYTSNGQETTPQEGRSMAFRNELDPEPGTWVHLAATWSCGVEASEMVLYLNGERIAACAGAIILPEAEPQTFEIGGPLGSGTTAFDDVMVLLRPLTPREVAALVEAGRGARPDAVAAELPFRASRELQITAYPLFAGDRLVVVADCRGARRELAGRPGTVTVTIAAQGQVVASSAAATVAGLARVEFSRRDLGAGPIRIAAVLRDAAGQQVRSGALAAEVPERPVWVGNDLGKTAGVPPPWVPLVADDRSVTAWGRRYEFRDSALPSQVTTQERTLLRQPISLTMRERDGAASALAVRRSGRIEATDAVVSQGWSGALGPLRCDGSVGVEFDGLVLIRLALAPTRPVPVEHVELRVSLAPGVATLFHHADGSWSHLSDAGGIGVAGWRKSLPFVPYMWVGDERAGLAWCCETDAGWQTDGGDGVVVLERTSAGVDLCVRVVNRPATITVPLELTFGFMATPVKPLPERWRDWRPMFASALNIEAFSRLQWRAEGCRNIAVLWNNHVGSFSYLATVPEEMRAKVGVLHGNGWDTVVSYYALNQTQTGTPEFAVSEREWRRNPYGEQTFSLGSYATVCTASTWADFLLWAIDKTMDETGTDGVYLDCSNPRFCRSVEHGCAPGGYPLLATRELQKRIYTLVRQKRGENGFVYSHNSENNFITTYAFADAVVNGEQYNRKDLTTLSFEKFRAQFLPHPTGIPTFLLPTLVKFQPAKQEKMPGAQFLAFPYLHDVICLPQWMSRESQDLLLRVNAGLRAFDVSDSTFLPYWSRQGMLRCDPGSVLVSSYIGRDDRRVLLTARGVSEPVTLALAFDGALAGLTGQPARDVLDDCPLGWHGETMRWPLAPHVLHLAVVGAE